MQELIHILVVTNLVMLFSFYLFIKRYEQTDALLTVRFNLSVPVPEPKTTGWEISRSIPKATNPFTFSPFYLFSTPHALCSLPGHNSYSRSVGKYHAAVDHFQAIKNIVTDQEVSV